MCSKLNCTERYEFQTLNILSKKISVTSFANSESSRINTSHSTTLQEFVYRFLDSFKMSLSFGDFQQRPQTLPPLRTVDRTIQASSEMKACLMVGALTQWVVFGYASNNDIILCFSMFYSWTWISMDICRPGSKWTWKEFKNPTKKPACTGAAHYAQVDEPLISHLFPSLVMSITVFTWENQ